MYLTLRIKKNGLIKIIDLKSERFVYLYWVSTENQQRSLVFKNLVQTN
jgi:hypothetical protein